MAFRKGNCSMPDHQDVMYSPKRQFYRFWGFELISQSAASMIRMPSCWYSGWYVRAIRIFG